MPRTEEGFKSTLASLSFHALGIMALTLCFITLRVGSAYFRLRGPSLDLALLHLLGFLAGVAFSALTLHAWERRVSAPGSSCARSAFILYLLLPGIYSTVLFFVADFSVSPVADTLQACLWGMPLPIALYLFFRHVRPKAQILWYGFATGLGHLFLAIAAPFIGEGEGISLAPEDKDRIVIFLLMLRNGALMLMAGAAAALAFRTPPYRAADARRAEDDRTPGGLVLSLLLPVALLYFLGGYQTVALGQPIAAIERHVELVNLLLVFLFFFLGLVFSYRQMLLANCFVASVCFLSLLAILRLFPEYIPTAAVNLAADAAERVLMFCAIPALGRLAFGLPFRFPALVCCGAYFTLLALIPGRISAMKLQAVSGEALIPCLPLIAAVCLVSAFFLRRAFPLPQLPSPPLLPGTEGMGALPDEKAKLLAFAAAFGLTEREAEVLSGVISGREQDDLAGALGITGRTVRFHLGGLLKKTGMINRKRLLMFYASWRA